MKKKIALTISMAVALSMAAPTGYANAAVTDSVAVAENETVEEVVEETSESDEVTEETTMQEDVAEENVEAFSDEPDKKFFDDEEEHAIKAANDEYSGTYTYDSYDGSYTYEINWNYNPDSKILTLTGEGSAPSGIHYDNLWGKYKDEIKEVEVGEGITNVDFSYFEKIEKVTLPNTVNGIYFAGCSSLVDINIPSSLTSFSFAGCSSLKKVDFSNATNITTSADRAFEDCTSLEEVVGFENIKTNSLNSTFANCTSLKSITLSDNVEFMTFTFKNCTSLENVTLPKKLKTMGSAFLNCTSLKEIDIPMHVESMKNAFEGCTNLKTANFDSNNDAYSLFMNSAFKDCTSLENVNLPESTYQIIDTFVNCSSLKEIKIPARIVEIDMRGTFVGCTGLRVVYMPEDIYGFTSGDVYSAFRDCNLDRIYFSEKLKYIQTIDFVGLNSKEFVFGGTLEQFMEVANDNNVFYLPNEDPNKKWFRGKLIVLGTKPVVKSAANKDDKVEIKWDAIDNELVDGYNVYRKTADSDWQLVGNASGTSFVDSTVKSGTKYYYSVSGTGIFKRVPFETGYNEDGVVVETPKATNKNDDKKDEDNKKEDNKTTEDKTTENKKEDNKTTEDKTTEDKKEETKPEKVADVTVSYHTHIQSIGDGQGNKKNGQMAGTIGQSKRLESINIAVSGNDNLGIAYTTHVQSIGWLPWSANNELSGTTGESKRLEAIKIILTGKDADKYDIYYRVHAQSYGWLDWAKNGEIAGTAGLSKRLEAIQIVVVEKNKAIDKNMGGIKSTNAVSYVIGTSNTSEPAKYEAAAPNVLYRTHVQTIGWQNWKANGTMAGTSGMSKRLEGINIKLTNCDYTGGIQYKTHVQTYGWEKEWKSNGAMSGTSGESKRLEAIMIELTGEMAKHYDVYYRVHSQTYGWLAWAKNGEPAGTEGMSKRLEGIQIVVVKKGEKAPTNNYGGVVSANSKAFLK